VRLVPEYRLASFSLREAKGLRISRRRRRAAEEGCKIVPISHLEGGRLMRVFGRHRLGSPLRLRVVLARGDGPLQLLNLVNIRTDALMQIVRIGIPQMLANLDSNLAKQRHRVRQRIPVVC
jgi:hypothetical protein